MQTQQTTSDASPVTTRSAGVRYGMISGIVSILLFLIFILANINMTEGPWKWVGWIVTVALVVLAHKYYKDNANGFMSYGQGVQISLWMGMVSAAVSSVFTYVYIKFIDASFLEMIKDKQIQAMEEQGMSEEQIEQGMKFASMFMSPEAMLLFGLIGGVISALIIGLLVSIFTQKKAPETAF